MNYHARELNEDYSHDIAYHPDADYTRFHICPNVVPLLYTIPKSWNQNTPPKKVAPHEAAILETTWKGEGTEADYVHMDQIIEDAKYAQSWFACGCREEEGIYPILAPGYLMSHGTFYLRRLQGKGRVHHSSECVFHKAQSLVDRAPPEEPAYERPVGYFTGRVAKPDDRYERKLPQLASLSTIGQTNQGSMLSRQLWRLLDIAGLCTLPSVIDYEAPDLNGQFDQIGGAASKLEVSDGVLLSTVMETHVNAIYRNSIFAKVHQTAQVADLETPLQGFVLAYARDVDTKGVNVSGKTPIRPLGGIDVLGPDGPYLVLLQVQEVAEDKLRILKGVAQPILSGRRFMPVRDQKEREIFNELVNMQFKQKRRFDLRFHRLPFGTVDLSPSSIVGEVCDLETGELSQIVIDPMLMGLEAHEVITYISDQVKSLNS